MEPKKGRYRKCANPACDNLTRTTTETLRDHPGTMIRVKGGYCVECYQPQVPPCKKCGQALRRSSVPVSAAPGTKVRHGEGMCKVCYLAVYPPAPPVEVSPEQLAETVRGLDEYMARRRARLAVAS